VSAWLLLGALLLPAETAVRLPLANDGLSEHRAVAAGLDATLAALLAAREDGPWLDLGALSGTLSDAQVEDWRACADEPCARRLAADAEVDRVLLGKVAHKEGVWVLRLRLVSTAATKEVHWNTRMVDGLAAGVELQLLQLLDGPQAVLAHPHLARKLGTPRADVVEELRVRVERGEPDVARAWTDMVLAHNAPSEALRASQGLMVLASGALLATMVFLAAPALVLAAAGLQFHGPTQAPLPDRANANGTYNFPILALAGMVAWLGLGLPALGGLGIAGLLAAAEGRPRNRVPLQPVGCCRDDRRVDQARSVGWGRRVAPFLALGGAGAALLTPMVLLLSSGAVALGLLLAFPTSSTRSDGIQETLYGPTVPVPRAAYGALEVSVLLTQGMALVGMVVVVTLVAALWALGLLALQDAQVLDAPTTPAP
jgi:hypothetical protein